MTRDKFKLIHSELIMQVQCIESDLRIIYAAMKSGDFEDNYEELEKANLGRIIKCLKELDYSDGLPDLSEADYELIDQIREIRNFWCHQCYLDYIYIQDEVKRERRFQEIANRLSRDENRTWDLHEKLTQNVAEHVRCLCRAIQKVLFAQHHALSEFGRSMFRSHFL